MLLHSAQKACQEATWEFPQREIELVLTQAERKAAAESWIIVPDQFPGCREDTGTCFPLWQRGCRGAWKTAAPADRITCMLSCTLSGAALCLFNLGAVGADYGSDRSHLSKATPSLRPLRFLLAPNLRSCEHAAISSDDRNAHSASLGFALRLHYCNEGTSSPRRIFGFSYRPPRASLAFLSR